VRCQIPVSVQKVKEADPAAAIAWREATRAVFTRYFERGYFARECVHVRGDGAGGEPQTVYLFERGDLETDGTRD
jgi:predicted GNAT superfamily acetyltransferase